MEFASSHIFALFLQYGYLAIFIGVILENSRVILIYLTVKPLALVFTYEMASTYASWTR